MNFYYAFIGILIIIYGLSLFIVYHAGTQKSFRYFLSFLIPMILAGTAVYIGHIVLPNSTRISLYIAGIGTILFHFILTPIFIKKRYDRYNKISKRSRIFACIIGSLNFWLMLSFIVFFFNLFYTCKISEFESIISIITIPIRFLWFFPKI